MAIQTVKRDAPETRCLFRPSFYLNSLNRDQSRGTEILPRDSEIEAFPRREVRQDDRGHSCGRGGEQLRNTTRTERLAPPQVPAQKRRNKASVRDPRCRTFDRSIAVVVFPPRVRSALVAIPDTVLAPLLTGPRRVRASTRTFSSPRWCLSCGFY